MLTSLSPLFGRRCHDCLLADTTNRSGRGNIFLESAVPLVKSLQREIIRLGTRLENAADAEESLRPPETKPRRAESRHLELMLIIRDIKDLLALIDRDIPLIQLAITASGESLSTSLPPGVSPSRLLQASTFLTVGDTQFASDPSRPVQIGPSFTLSLYMLFVGHSATQLQKGGDGQRPVTPYRADSKPRDPPQHPVSYGLGDGERKPIWQEIIHKSRVRICRTPLNWVFDKAVGYRSGSSIPLAANGYPGSDPNISAGGQPHDYYSYHLEIVEDLDDGRVHDGDSGKLNSFDNIRVAGIRESIPIYQIAKIFYTDTGRILNIGNAEDGDNNPILLLKRDLHAHTPIGTVVSLTGVQGEGQDEDEDTESDCSDGQLNIDRQLREESERSQHHGREVPQNWQIPQHLDQEWLAMEVFTEDDDDDSTSSDGEYDGDQDDGTRAARMNQLSFMKPRHRNQRSSLDSKLLMQIRNLSVGSSPSMRNHARPSSSGTEAIPTGNPESLVARSPFGAIASSLSLMEMLIRLTSLQEFQQMPHLAIPDHILTFFLEETSTTGLRGEERWKVRNEAKKRVGFDPYTDTPTR